jgi:copper chaperone
VVTVTVLVPAMTCRHCVRTVTASLRDVAGVERVEADARTRTVTVRGGTSPAAVLAALTGCGFPGRVLDGGVSDGEEAPGPA